jgi:hypothetical protein
MNLNEPTVYISIISSSLLIISELLPFLPTNCNGLLHTLFKISPCCKKCNEFSETNKNEIIVERMLYKLLDNIEELESHNVTAKDIKGDIKKIIQHIHNTEV